MLQLVLFACVVFSAGDTTTTGAAASTTTSAAASTTTSAAASTTTTSAAIASTTTGGPPPVTTLAPPPKAVLLYNRTDKFSDDCAKDGYTTITDEDTCKAACIALGGNADSFRADNWEVSPNCWMVTRPFMDYLHNCGFNRGALSPSNSRDSNNELCLTKAGAAKYPQGPPKVAVQSGPCAYKGDLAGYCWFWADDGYCKTGDYVSWMTTNCARTCCERNSAESEVGDDVAAAVETTTTSAAAAVETTTTSAAAAAETTTTAAAAAETTTTSAAKPAPPASSPPPVIKPAAKDPCKGKEDSPAPDANYCVEWKNEGFCTGTWESYMAKHCALTCCKEKNTAPPKPTSANTVTADAMYGLTTVYSDTCEMEGMKNITDAATCQAACDSAVIDAKLFRVDWWKHSPNCFKVTTAVDEPWFDDRWIGNCHFNKGGPCKTKQTDGTKICNGQDGTLITNRQVCLKSKESEVAKSNRLKTVNKALRIALEELAN